MSKQPELHVNIDHVATVRQARLTYEPSPLQAVKILEETNTAGITIHLREDRRHIQDSDVYEIDEYLKDSKLSLTFEMDATSEEIRTVCLKTKAKLATLVPEKREELTTEGGLDLIAKQKFLTEFIKPIQANQTLVSIFVDPIKEQIDAVKAINADFIELHTGSFANYFIDDFKEEMPFNKSHDAKNFERKLDYSKLSEKTINEAKRLKEAANYAKSIGLRVNLGHGLTLENLPLLLAGSELAIDGGIPEVEELHIGHSLIANSIFSGVKKVANDYLNLIEVKSPVS